MNLSIGLLICATLALCQAQSIISDPVVTTTASTLTDDLIVPNSEVTSQTPPAHENVTIAATDPVINEVLSFGENVMLVVSQRLNDLQPEMRPVGEKILADTRDGLQMCEGALRQTGTIWEYKVCCSSYLRYAMSTFAGLVVNSTQSGAARPMLFFM